MVHIHLISFAGCLDDPSAVNAGLDTFNDPGSCAKVSSHMWHIRPIAYRLGCPVLYCCCNFHLWPLGPIILFCGRYEAFKSICLHVHIGMNRCPSLQTYLAPVVKVHGGATDISWHVVTNDFMQLKLPRSYDSLVYLEVHPSLPVDLLFTGGEVPLPFMMGFHYPGSQLVEEGEFVFV